MKRHFRCIILVIASNNNVIYEMHKRIWNRYKNMNPNIRVFFVYGKIDHDIEDFDPECDLVYSSIGEISDVRIGKTIEAMKTIDEDYSSDYFVRTNLSTFWDFDKLLIHLGDLPDLHCYCGDGPLPCYTQNGYYLSGSDTIISYDVFRLFLDNLDKINHHVVDDKAMGELIHGYLGVAMIQNRICFFEDIRSENEISRIDERIDQAIIENKDHYRIKTSNADRHSIDLVICKRLLFKIYHLSFFPKEIADSIFVTGGSGMIGSRLHFGMRPTSKEVDITDYHTMKRYIDNNMKNISCILHLAALNLRDSENDPKKSIHVNIEGTNNLIKIAREKDVPFILVSTGAVFSSCNGNSIFDEKCVKTPNCIYGCTKSTSEELALTYDKTIIARTGWLFGGHQKTHYKFVENTIMNLLANQVVHASDDFYGSPTYVYDFIEQLKYLIENKKYGIHHVINSEYASGYDIATEIASLLNKSTDQIIAWPAEKIPNSGPKRSNTEMLVSIHAYNKLRDWRSALKEYVTKYVKNMECNLSNDLLSKKKWSNREQCRLCKSHNLYIFFQLNPTPPANHFVKQPQIQEVIPLDVAICNNCFHIQLVQIIDPDFQYSHYFYVSSTTQTMVHHLQNSCLHFTQMYNINKEDFILEIGANDGVCIRHLLNHHFINTVGVDPAKNISKRHNLPILCDFFGSKICRLLQEKYEPFKLIFAFHCCAHIEDIHDVFETVFQLLDEDGIFIMEVGYFYEVFKNNAFDTIYHEHIDYHTVTAMIPFAISKNLELINVDCNTIQGGSIQFHFCKRNNLIPIQKNVHDALQKEQEIQLFHTNVLCTWKNNIIRTGRDLSSILNAFKSEGKTIVGYGASAKSTTFLYQFRITKNIIHYIIDDNIYKQNFYTPGLNIPIHSFHIMELQHVDYVLLLSWNFCKEIIEKLKEYRKNGLRIIIPFPEIQII